MKSLNENDKEKTKVIRFKAGERELKIIKELTEKYDICTSELIRIALQNEYDTVHF